MAQNRYSRGPGVITKPTRKVHLVFTQARDNRSMTLKSKERRAAKRYSVGTAMEYRISGGAWKAGRILDMSAGGVLADTLEGATAGSTVEFAIQWPGIYYGKSVVRLDLTACVARLDDRGSALRILSHHFRDAYPAVVRPRRSERNLAVA